MNKLQTLRRVVGDSALRASCAVAALLGPALAFAQTDPFDAAVTDITAKIGTYGAALVGVAAVGVGFMVGMKYIKKLPRAS